MRHTKEEKVAYLFDEIGGISDVLVAEAMAYRPKRRSMMPKYLAVAASLLVCCILFVTLLLPAKNNAGQESNSSGDGAPYVSLDAMLTNASAELRYTELSSREELNFFGKQAYLVWQEEGSDTLCVSRPLTYGELQRLTRAATEGTSVGEEEVSLQYRVWILCGDGTVITPYLQQTAGTVGYGELFDYDPELYPSQSFTTLVSDLLT
ncbi:MAG: hypothetical protein IJX28_06525 [Clostridia bacterium]|nr:hypothetical protein [Clostridia bacterium]